MRQAKKTNNQYGTTHQKVGNEVNDMSEIMIIDDDVYINNMLKETLSGEGYDVYSAYSGTEAELMLKTKNPDLILLDLMLPGITGEELITRIKNIPVIVISAKADTNDKVNLLLNGAEDYVTKPFDMEELLARIKVRLRTNGTKDRSVIRVNEVTLYADRLTAEIDGTEIRFTRTEAAILKLLMQNPHTPVGRTAILDNISMDTPDCTDRSLKQHISNIRHKLQAVSGKDYIEAIYGIGFKFKNQF